MRPALPIVFGTLGTLAAAAFPISSVPEHPIPSVDPHLSIPQPSHALRHSATSATTDRSSHEAHGQDFASNGALSSDTPARTTTTRPPFPSNPYTRKKSVPSTQPPPPLPAPLPSVPPAPTASILPAPTAAAPNASTPAPHPSILPAPTNAIAPTASIHRALPVPHASLIPHTPSFDDEDLIPEPPPDPAPGPDSDTAPDPASNLPNPPHPPPSVPPFTPDIDADLPSYLPTAADHLLDTVFHDHAHDNDGTHLNGDIADDAVWQQHWLRMVQLHTTRYQAPPGKVGRRFIAIFTNELRGVRARQWNSERPIVFVAVILQSTPGVRRSKDIRTRITQRLDLWEQGHYKALVDDTECEVLSYNPSPCVPSDDSKARSFHNTVLSGRLRSAVRKLTGRSGGGVCQPDDLCTKSHLPVWQVLAAKHPPLRDPTFLGTPDGAFEPYLDLPLAIPLCITPEDVEILSSRLSGAAGPGGTDAVDLTNWLLRFGTESDGLRSEMAAWANWLANTHPPWAAYRAMMANRLVALDKEPGTRPVGIGEIYRRLWAKCVLKSVGTQATAACGNFNLCAGLQAGIEGAVHAVHLKGSP